MITPTPIQTVSGCRDPNTEVMAATPEAMETATVRM